MRRVLLLSSLVLVLAPACVRSASPAVERELVYQAGATLTVRIVNRSQLDATIYLVHDGSRDRLGLATAASSSTFSVPARTLGSGEFSLLADPIGGRRTASTERLYSAQGSVFSWTLETDFSRGGVLVQD